MRAFEGTEYGLREFFLLVCVGLILSEDRGSTFLWDYSWEGGYQYWGRKRSTYNPCNMERKPGDNNEQQLNDCPYINLSECFCSRIRPSALKINNGYSSCPSCNANLFSNPEKILIRKICIDVTYSGGKPQPSVTIIMFDTFSKYFAYWIQHRVMIASVHNYWPKSWIFRYSRNW